MVTPMADLNAMQKSGVEAFRAGNYELAKERFSALIEAAREENNPAKVAEAQNDLGVVLKILDDLDGALAALHAALKYYQSVDDEHGEAQVLGNFGMVEAAAGQYEDAIQSYLDSATIFEELGDSEMAMYSWQALSKLQLHQKDWINAIASYEEGIAHLPDNSIKKKIVQALLKTPQKFLGR